MAGLFDSRSFLDQQGNWWWDPDKFVPVTANLVLVLEKLEAELQSSAISGDVACSFEVMQCLMADPPPQTGEMVVSFEQPEFTATGTQLNSSGSIEVSFVEPIISMFAGRGMVCTFELFEINIKEEYNMADMEISFKEPSMLATGENTFIGLDLEFEEFEIGMSAGSGLLLEMEDFILSASGTVGIVGNIQASISRMDLSAIGGDPPYIDAVMEPMSMTGSGHVSSEADLSATFRKFDCVMHASISNVSALDVRFMLPAASMFGETYPVGSIDLEFVPMRFSAEAIENITAELDVTLSLLKMKASMISDGPNDFDVVFEDPEFDGYGDGLGESGAECDLAETLVYGGL